MTVFHSIIFVKIFLKDTELQRILTLIFDENNWKMLVENFLKLYYNRMFIAKNKTETVTVPVFYSI
ncbi:MAG: hypothetical protein DI622_16520 [Chryseobacterium sp.]|nr:MAG: hypothetical protein DI622_16520 [Chryseobacterium sp.]